MPYFQIQQTLFGPHCNSQGLTQSATLSFMTCFLLSVPWNNLLCEWQTGILNLSHPKLISINGTSIHLVAHARNLRVIWDTFFFLTIHSQSITMSCQFYLLILLKFRTLPHLHFPPRPLPFSTFKIKNVNQIMSLPSENPLEDFHCLRINSLILNMAYTLLYCLALPS